MNFDIHPFILSLKISLITTSILLAISLPAAWGIVRAKGSVFSIPLRVLINLPLVVPPTVLGFYFLLMFGPSSILGGLLESFLSLSLLFTFEGLIVGSVLFSIPFMINPIITSMEMISENLIESSYLLGKSGIETFLRIVIPNCIPGILSGMVITFVHTMGEFGLVLMIGGKIPGKTLTASMAVFDYVESFQYLSAHIYSMILVLISIIVLGFLLAINNRFRIM